MADDLHEARVKAFMREAEQSAPQRFRDVCELYPVKSDAQLGHIRRREIAFGDPGSFADEIRALGAVRLAVVPYVARKAKDRPTEYDEYGQYREQPGNSLPLTEEDRTLHRLIWEDAFAGWRGLDPFNATVARPLEVLAGRPGGAIQPHMGPREGAA